MKSDLHKKSSEIRNLSNLLTISLEPVRPLRQVGTDCIRFHINKFMIMEKNVEKPAKWPDVADPPQISSDDKVRFKSPAITRFLSESRPLLASVVQKFFSPSTDHKHSVG
jgi:hypothetical protein